VTVSEKERVCGPLPEADTVSEKERDAAPLAEGERDLNWLKEIDYV
jgi:hypothetical protein